MVFAWSSRWCWSPIFSDLPCRCEIPCDLSSSWPAPFAAILCNVIRILPTVCLYGHYGSDSVVGQRFHDYSGWLMLPISFLILLGIIAALRWAMVPVMRYTLAS